MYITRCTPQEYKALFPTPSHVFNTVEFNELNRHKCDDVHYLLFSDDKGKVRFGIILGLRGDVLKSPFSAPFGGIEERGGQSVNAYLEAMRALKAYGVDCGCEVVLILPPAIYSRGDGLALQYCSAMTSGARQLCADYNYYYELGRADNFEEYCSRAARKNYSSATRHDWHFESLDGTERDIERVYGIIKANRDGHGYPLRMSLEDVKATSQIISCSFLVLSHDGEDVAAVLAYDVTPEVSQVIYWGDVPGYSALRPMNMLAHETFDFFASHGKKILDIGPSSSDGLPSLGLCDFKASIGCSMTPKFTIVL